MHLEIIISLIFITFLVSLNMGSLSIKPLDVFKTGKQFSTDKSTPGLLLDGQFFVECLSGDKLVPLFNGLVEYLDKAKAENSAVSESDNSATKYCPNCGTALRGQAKFCSKCGYKL